MNSTRTGSAGCYPYRRSPNGAPSPEAQARMTAALAAQRPAPVQTRQSLAARVEGYHGLTPGTEFIALQGKAVPLAYVTGTRYDSGFFQMTFGGQLYEVLTREETDEEREERHARERAAARKVVSSFDPFDCQEAVWEMA